MFISFGFYFKKQYSIIENKGTHIFTFASAEKVKSC